MACGRKPFYKEAFMSTVEIIKNRGYPVEIHSVTTKDGYVLELHRVPRGKEESRKTGCPAAAIVERDGMTRHPVLLQHGFVAADHVWLLSSTDQALAYVLADLGYDVWLGNFRGNPYSRKHVVHDSSSEKFWDFSFDEIGKHDIPACIDYVLERTGSDTMSYVGHSMGCGVFYMAMHHRPELNEKIRAMISLAPAASFHRTKLSMRYLVKFFGRQFFSGCRMFGISTYETNNCILHNLQRTFFGPNMLWRKPIGAIRAFSLAEEDWRNVDQDIIPVIDRHHPAGASLRSAEQITQHFFAGETFRAYDFGPVENQKRYGQVVPPAYDLHKVTCPVYIFWGRKDRVCVPEDVEWLASKLDNVKYCAPVDDSNWGHCAFVFAKNAKQSVYDKLVTFLPSPFTEQV